MNVQLCPACLKMIPVYSINCLLTFPPNPELFCQCPGITLILTATTLTTSTGTTITFSGNAVQQPRVPVPPAFYDAFTDEEVAL